MDGGTTNEHSSLGDTELDALLREVLARVEGVLDEKERLRLLLDAVVTVAADLSLDGVLARIVTIAGALVDARYAALGVLGEGADKRLRMFIHHGIPDEAATVIGDLPTGHGLLGLIIDRPEPLRLHDIAEHPSSYGFPAEHPRMHSFLGVPIRTRGRVFGNLYLTEKAGGTDFTAQDEEIVVALAAAVGVVIENARLYEATQRREVWSSVTAEVTALVAASSTYDETLDTIADRARHTAGSDHTWIVSSSGPGAGEVVASSSAGGDLPGGASGLPVRLDSPATGLEPCPWLSVPVGADRLGRPLVLALGWSQGRRDAFDEVDPALPESFGKQVGLAIAVSQGRETDERLAVLEDRDRIGRDLHDLVIQRLFAVGLGLESTARRSADPGTAERLATAVDDLDATIKDIRRTIFALGTVGDSTDLQSEVTRMVERARETLKFRPSLTFEGPVRTLVPPEVAPDLLAVLAEAISNASRHAEASTLDIVLAVGRDVVLTVTDDGRGLPGAVVESGVRNIRHRALRLGGSFAIGDGPNGGTRLVWAVPAVRADAPERPPT